MKAESQDALDLRDEALRRDLAAFTIRLMRRLSRLEVELRDVRDRAARLEEQRP